MIFAFFTMLGESLPIAYQLQEAGYEVYVGMVDSWQKLDIKQTEDTESRKRRFELYDGLLKHKYDADVLLKALLKVKSKDEFFIFCDFNYLYNYADKLREAGFKGLLPHKEDAKLEEDRKLAKQVVQAFYNELEPVPNYEFKTIDEAIKFIQQRQELFVLKGNSPEAFTFVPQGTDVKINHEEIITTLQQFKDVFEKDGFILEEKITDIIEFTPEAIAFDGEVLTANIDIELKFLGAGDTGYQTGCSGDYIFYVDIGGEIFKKFLQPLMPFMVRPNEMTVWDASVLYSPSRQKFYFGEYCPDRVGYNAVFTEMTALGGADVYFDYIMKKQKFKADKVATSINIFNLTLKKKEWADELIFDFPDGLNYWIWDVKKRGDTKVNVGYDKSAGVVTASGTDINEAAEQMYKNLEQVHLSAMYYRPKHDFLSTDYPTSIPNRLKVLQEMFNLGGE